MNDETKLVVVNRLRIKRELNPGLFEHLRWVALAVAKEDVRNCLNSLHATDYRLEATDGHRLHRVDFPTEDVPAGVPYVNDGTIVAPLQNANWIVVKRAKTIIELERAPQESFDKWPDTDRVLRDADDEPNVKGIMRQDEGYDSAGDVYLTLHHKLFRYSEEHFYVWKYFQDAVSYEHGMLTWSVAEDGAGVKFASDGPWVTVSAFVMPCKRRPTKWEDEEELREANEKADLEARAAQRAAAREATERTIEGFRVSQV